MIRVAVLCVALAVFQGHVQAQGRDVLGRYGLTFEGAQSLKELRLRRSEDALLQFPGLEARFTARLVELQDHELNRAILGDLSSSQAIQKANARLQINELSRVTEKPAGAAAFSASGLSSESLRQLSLRTQAPVEELSALKKLYGVDIHGRLLLRPEVLIVNPERVAPRELPAGRLPLGHTGPPPIWRNGLLFSVAVGSVDDQGVPYAFCSGTIVNKRWIVTAAHCLRLEGERLDARRLFAYLPFQGGTIAVRNIAGGWDQGMRKLSVAEATWGGDHRQELFPLSEQDMAAMVRAGGDVALLKLSEAEVNSLPLSIPDVKIVGPSAVRAPVSLVGYGLSNVQAIDSLSMSVGLLRDLPTGIAAGRNVFHIGDPGEVGTGLCGGDSGGGIFAGRVDGSPGSPRELFGVISGLNGNPSSELAYCISSQQMFTPLLSERNRDFICKAAAKACPG